MDSAGRVIYVDPGVMGNWTASRIFTLAHECAHHRLGHVTPQGFWFRNTQFWATRAQELEADCWAARQLSREGYDDDLQRTMLQFASMGAAPQGTYPSGLERAQTVARCGGLRQAAPSFASMCATPFGACPMAQAVPIGAPCYCPAPAGPIGGVAR
jgi:hypothetical protein